MPSLNKKSFYLLIQTSPRSAYQSKTTSGFLKQKQAKETPVRFFNDRKGKVPVWTKTKKPNKKTKTIPAGVPRQLKTRVKSKTLCISNISTLLMFEIKLKYS